MQEQPEEEPAGSHAQEPQEAASDLQGRLFLKSCLPEPRALRPEASVEIQSSRTNEKTGPPAEFPKEADASLGFYFWAREV